MQDYILPIYMDFKKNYRTIRITYDLLNSANDLRIPIHSAGQWLLDNMYIVEQEYTVTLEALKGIKEYTLPYVKAEGKNKELRVVFMANEIVEKNSGIVTDGIVSNYIREFQKHTYITFAELSLLPLMIRFSLIKFLRRICGNVFNAEMQKLKVERRINNTISNDAKIISNKMMKLMHKLKSDISQTNTIKSTNTAYIEYMAFRLKDMGKKGEKYLAELKEETTKTGFTIDEAIEREHTEITTTTRLISNAIMSLKTVGVTNWGEVIVDVNRIDETLKDDFTNEYYKCDFKTKNRYRNNVVRLAKKYKMSEMYVAKKAVECSIEHEKHVGHFLIGEDKDKLVKSMGKSTFGIKFKNKVIDPAKPYVHILLMITMASLLTYIINENFIEHYKTIYRVLICIVVFSFGMEIADKIISYLVGKIVRPKVLPRFNFAKTIDPEYKTIIAMPSVINSTEKLDKMINKMEVTYLANRSENMYYMLLGDCVGNKTQKHIKLDDELIDYGRMKIDELNNKYPSSTKLFNFLYRKRVFSESEGTYMGWERKRGALSQLNKLLLGKLSENEKCEYFTLAHDDIPTVKYVITVDEDTMLSLNTAKELVAIISHPLNKPVLSNNGKTVKSGYGLIQPAVGLDIESANNTIFSKVFGGFGGLDIYTNAISNLYQDVFKEAIFTGKGIYDVALFEKLLGDTMPENLILSHDLLEGSYMRTGLASDVEVQDGFPYNFIAYMKRNHRWYRGDMQIISWLFSFKSPLNALSKWKIFDNLRRETLDVFAMILLFITMCIPGTSFVYACLFIFIVENFGHILSTLDNLILGKNAEIKQKQYIPVIYGIRANFLKMVFNFITIPYKAWITISAHMTSLYRMFISKKKLLEWATAESIEANAKEKLWYVYKNMWSNVLFGLILLICWLIEDYIFVKDYSILLFSLFFMLAPLAAYVMSKKYLFKRDKELSQSEEQYFINVGKDTWKFFETSMNELNNYLVPDNYQENRRPKFVSRTSSTNIGFGLLSIMNAYDLKYISLEEAIDKLYNSLFTVNKLQKWRGHLYNWYNIRTLEPLNPRFISTVDSGNFVACVYVINSFLLGLKSSQNIDLEKTNYMLSVCNNIISNTDYTALYVPSKNIFSIGFDIEKNELVPSYYDMLMSESRLTSLIAIATRQVTSKHWFSLARNLVSVDFYKGLLSWSGTSFEYFMPNLFTKTYNYTLIDEALSFAMHSQKKYGKAQKLPWGISESAFAVQDDMQNYQYKAFGIPWLGLKRGLNDTMVISPYSSIMCLTKAPKKVYNNAKLLEKYNAYSAYGFYEAVDFTKAHIGNDKKYETVKTVMAHHQGMIFTAINNYVNNNIVQNRFHSNPDIKAAEILLKERVPIGVTIKENLRNKYNKFVENSLETYTSHISYTDLNSINNRNINIHTNGKLSSTVLNTGENFIYYKDSAITKNKYSERSITKGNTLIFTDKTTGKIWSGTYNPNYCIPEKYSALFTLGSSEYYRKDGDIETYTRLHLAYNYDVEIRKYTLVNRGNERKEIVINTELELAMCNQAASNVHPAFNNLLIEEYYDEDLGMLIAKRRRRDKNSKELYVYAKLLGIDLGIECETEKIKLIKDNARDAYDEKIINYPLNPVISYRARILLDPGERQSFYYLVGAAEDKYSISHAIVGLDDASLENSYKYAIQKENVTARYLKLGRDIACKYNELISKVLFSVPTSIGNVNDYWDLNLKQSMFWKFGISGDLPIIEVPIGKIEDTALIDEIINFMDYIKSRRIDIDIVILVDEELYTGEPIKSHLLKRLENLAYIAYTRGDIYVLNVKEMNQDEIKLFDLMATIKITSVEDLKPDILANTNTSLIDEEVEDEK